MATSTHYRIDKSAIHLPTATPNKTLGEARKELLKGLLDGRLLTCPCCGGDVKIYCRGISPKMLASLNVIARAPDGLTSKEITQLTNQGGGGDHAKLRYWGLVERRKSRWHITAKGMHWLLGRVAIPSKVLTFHRIDIGFDEGTMITAFQIDRSWSLDEVLSAQATREALNSPNFRRAA